MVRARSVAAMESVFVGWLLVLSAVVAAAVEPRAELGGRAARRPVASGGKRVVDVVVSGGAVGSGGGRGEPATGAQMGRAMPC